HGHGLVAGDVDAAVVGGGLPAHGDAAGVDQPGHAGDVGGGTRHAGQTDVDQGVGGLLVFILELDPRGGARRARVTGLVDQAVEGLMHGVAAVVGGHAAEGQVRRGGPDAVEAADRGGVLRHVLRAV